MKTTLPQKSESTKTKNIKKQGSQPTNLLRALKNNRKKEKRIKVIKYVKKAEVRK